MVQNHLDAENVANLLQLEETGGHMRRIVVSFGSAYAGLILSIRGPLKTMCVLLVMAMLRIPWTCVMILMKKKIKRTILIIWKINIMITVKVYIYIYIYIYIYLELFRVFFFGKNFHNLPVMTILVYCSSVGEKEWERERMRTNSTVKAR